MLTIKIGNQSDPGHVILSAAKNLGLVREILRCAQNDMASARVPFDWLPGRDESRPYGPS